MITVKKHGVLLKKTDLSFEDEGVLNPGIIQLEDGTIEMLYRAVRKGNYSTIGHCKLSSFDKIEVRDNVPLIVADLDFEKHGIEDPRIVQIDDLYYITYTAYDGNNALGALATSKNLQNFKKHGIITP